MPIVTRNFMGNRPIFHFSSFVRILFVSCILLPASVVLATAQSTVFLPDFWDPTHRPEKPNLDDLRVIRFLTDDDYPPFHFALPDGSLSGFNVDLARALCEELKVVCSIQPRRWDTLIDAVAEGRGDAAIASLAINEASRAKVDFTAPYYRTPARFIARKAVGFAGPAPEALRGRKVGVEARTSHEAYLQQFFPALTLRPFDSAVGMRAALRSGEIDAIFGDGITLALWLAGGNSSECCTFVGGPYTESRYFGDGAGIAVRKDNATLHVALDYALQRLSERGIYSEIYLKYFPIGYY